MTLGERDGAPFFHCHGLWTEADGRLGGGHLLPEETMVAEDFDASAFGVEARCSWRSPTPRLISSCSARLPGRQPMPRTSDVHLRCACGRTRISPECWKSSAKSTDLARSPAWRCRFYHRCSFRRWQQDRAVRNRTGGSVGQHCRPPGWHPPGRARYRAGRSPGGTAEGRLMRGDNPVLMTMELVLEVL